MSKVKLVNETAKHKETKAVFKAYKALRIMIDVSVSAYMILVIAAMPFYNQEGYSHIGTDKSTFFRTISVYGAYVMIPLLLLCFGAYVIIQIREGNGLKEWKAFRISLSVTDWFAICFALVTIVSYISTDYHSEALWGTRGWYMGMLTQLTFVAVYFLISRLWEKKKWIPALFLPVSTVVFLLGYLNRFGVYPIKMQAASPSFISTIGNINWYCGYLVTVFFGGVYLLWSGLAVKRWQRAALYVYCGVGFGSLVTQGSSSGIMAMGVVLFFLFLLSVREEKKMLMYVRLVMVLAGACLVTGAVRLLFPEAMTYQEVTTDLFTITPLPLLMAATAGAVWLWVSLAVKKGHYPARVFGILGKAAAAAVAAGILLFFILLICNTLKPGSIGPLGEYGVFTFDPGWGSNRGATWMAGGAVFREQGLWKKLTGVGPDCMSAYIYGNGSMELQGLVREQFGDARLTNAHNEWITMLVNLGLLGMVSYGGMIVSAIVRFLRAGRYSGIAGACGLCVLAYTVNNMVSFQQSMNAVTLFVILGIGECCFRDRNGKILDGLEVH